MYRKPVGQHCTLRLCCVCLCSKVPVVFAESTADNDVPTGEDMKPEVDGETPSPDTDEYNLYLYINTHVYSKEGEDEGKKKDKGK